MGLGRRRLPRLLDRRLPAQDGVLVLEREQYQGGEQADQGQPAGSGVQEALAFYALARAEDRDGVAAGREVGGRRQIHDREYRRGDNSLGKGWCLAEGEFHEPNVRSGPRGMAGAERPTRRAAVWAGRPTSRATSRGRGDWFDARLQGVAGQFGAVAGTGLVPDPVQVR